MPSASVAPPPSAPRAREPASAPMDQATASQGPPSATGAAERGQGVAVGQVTARMHGDAPGQAETERGAEGQERQAPVR